MTSRFLDTGLNPRFLPVQNREQVTVLIHILQQENATSCDAGIPVCQINTNRTLIPALTLTMQLTLTLSLGHVTANPNPNAGVALGTNHR